MKAPWEPNWDMRDAQPTGPALKADVFQKRSGNWFVMLPARVTPKGPFATREEAVAFVIKSGYIVEG